MPSSFLELGGGAEGGADVAPRLRPAMVGVDGGVAEEGSLS